MLIGSAVLAICLTFSQDPASATRQVPEHLAYPKGYKAKPGVSYWNLSIPAPISTEQWEAYGDVLRLSDEQRRAVESAYDQYRR